MKIYYGVYRRMADPQSVPIVSYGGMPATSRQRRKFTGKKAKIEAIYRFSGVKLEQGLSSSEVDKYIKNHLFGTSKWKAYHDVFQIVANETELIEDEYEFLYQLEVNLEGSVDPADHRLLYLISSELKGIHLEEYEGLTNSILSLRQSRIFSSCVKP